MKKSSHTRLERLSAERVQQLAIEVYRQRGYDQLGGLLVKGDQRLMLQCDHWRARRISEMPVREFYGAMTMHAATCGMLISEGTFTTEAARFAASAGIELLDASQLRRLMQ